ncbi:hypothetical protein BH11PSE11_BH11PSE11_28480 [soil metagenome]
MSRSTHSGTSFRLPENSTNSYREFIMTKKTLMATALLVFAHSAVQAQAVLRDGALVDASGRTVYTFDKDAPGKSNCSGPCLSVWPAFVAKSGAVAQGEFGLIDADGGKQWTLRGKPLYYYAGDSKPGERNGDGSGGDWHIVAQGPAQNVSQNSAQPAAKQSESKPYSYSY